MYLIEDFKIDSSVSLCSWEPMESTPASQGPQHGGHIGQIPCYSGEKNQTIIFIKIKIIER